jgi:RecJ-like exonuclease
VTRKIDCPICYGEGCLEQAVPGGRFDSRAEQWYPLEQTKKCTLCKGSGSVDAPHHPNTFNASGEYAVQKANREAKRKATNQVVAYILNSSLDELEREEVAEIKQAA